MVNTEIRLIIFFAAEDGEALYSQQKQDLELTVDQIMSSLFIAKFRLKWRKVEKTTGASLVTQMVKNCLQCRRPGFNLLVRKIPWRRVWLPTPVFFPREFHGQRNLAGYSSWGCIELDTFEYKPRKLDFSAYCKYLIFIHFLQKALSVPLTNCQ